MLTPRYLESAPDAMVDLYSEVEADILADMARRIARYDFFIPAAEHQLRVLEEMGAEQTYILRPSTRPRSSSRCSAQGFGRPRASLPT